MRTGSNLLERSLNQFEGLECLGELFNPAFIGKPGREAFEGVDLAEREANPARILKKMVKRSSEALPGFRIFDGHDHRIIAKTLADPECGKIILRRRPLDSFLSLKIARQTDQWMLGNAPKRKSAVVDFDAVEFAAYLTQMDRYHSDLARGLQSTGQAAFEVRYEELKDTDVLNGVAAYLGLDEVIPNFAEKIKRQNPQTIEDKVSNYSELVAAVGGMGVDALDAIRSPETGTGLSVKDFIACEKAPLLFMPVPGVDARPVLEWMGEVDGISPGQLKTGMNQKRLGAWLDAAPDLTAFAVVDHPLERAFRVFCLHIHPKGDHIFPKIQRRLTEQFGLILPESAQDTAEAFEAFLVFLKVNLQGQTSIRIDANWEAQHKLLSGVQPLTRILRASDFVTAAGEMASINTPLTGLTAHQPDTALASIYSRRLENLARAAYAKDYAYYGFRDWTA